MCWWVATLPLEILRVMLCMPLAALIYIFTLNLTIQLWTAFWLLVHFYVLIPTGELAGRFDDKSCFVTMLFLGMTTRFALPLRQFNRFMLTPGWRLPPLIRYRPKKPILASITTAPTADPAQNRARMTTRLSPELQSMVARKKE